MSKKVQIEQDLFFDLVSYHLIHHDADLEDDIQDALYAKLRAVFKHNAYSALCKAKTPQERNNALRKYLETAGVINSDSAWNDFQTTAEWYGDAE